MLERLIEKYNSIFFEKNILRKKIINMNFEEKNFIF
jgi:hypothetical protein